MEKKTRDGAIRAGPQVAKVVKLTTRPTSCFLIGGGGRDGLIFVTKIKSSAGKVKIFSGAGRRRRCDLSLKEEGCPGEGIVGSKGGGGRPGANHHANHEGGNMRRFLHESRDISREMDPGRPQA